MGANPAREVLMQMCQTLREGKGEPNSLSASTHNWTAREAGRKRREGREEEALFRTLHPVLLTREHARFQSGLPGSLPLFIHHQHPLNRAADPRLRLQKATFHCSCPCAAYATALAGLLLVAAQKQPLLLHEDANER